MKKLLYINDGPPREGWGANIVPDRHLGRLPSDEWEIDIACFADRAGTATRAANRCIHSVRTLSFLRHLPLRGMHRVARFLWQMQIERAMRARPDCVLAVLQGNLAPLAATIARRYGVPLNLFVFDHRERWEANPAHQRSQYRETEALFREAARAWFVSERLIEEYGEEVQLPRAGASRVLRPIPHGGGTAKSVWRDGFSERPVVVHSGAIQSTHRPVVLAVADALAPFGGKLILVEKHGNATVEACVRERENVEHVPFFRTNQEAVEYVAGTATAAMHMYAFPPEVQGWATASFPSKLMEFTQTGVPMLLMSPPGTALHDWALANDWAGLCDDLSGDSLRRVLAPLCERDSWEAMAAQSRAVADDEFNPCRIQQQFEDELVVLS